MTREDEARLRDEQLEVTFLVGEWMSTRELAEKLRREQEQAQVESSEPSEDD
jgi:hypothetical protein